MDRREIRFKEVVRVRVMVKASSAIQMTGKLGLGLCQGLGYTGLGIWTTLTQQRQTYALGLRLWEGPNLSIREM